MRRPKASKTEARRPSQRPESFDPDTIDIEAPEYSDIEWDRLPRHSVDLDPTLVEAIRSRRTLKQVTLRIGVEQIEEARQVAKRTGTPYQAVLRRWLAQGASIARAHRTQLEQDRRARRKGTKKKGATSAKKAAKNRR
jgi:predicted DNA binding CopG/RHH family protein